MPRLVLASTSPYRRQLLERLGIEFRALPPGCDEAAIAGEAPAARALRLAIAKAQACHSSNTVSIGSDQVAALHDQVLHKPGTPERTLEQLLACQGQRVDFFTAVAVCAADGPLQSHVDHTRVIFRTLSRASLEYYITQDQPFACAGGFKAEGLGITLFERIESADPTALIGLPLIWLAGALRQVGLDPLQA